jgi:gamma-glutamylcyclotransferase (GGCT)/AIG2-like uncharacterized protein YtfP
MVMADEGMGADSAALVFVYGSLKRGQGHHDQMRGCAWQGEAELNGLALYDLGPFPMAVPSSDPTARLQGELYAVQGTQLARLDRFEGAPRLYERQRWQLSDGRAVWVYVGRARQVRHVRRIPSGCWRGRGMAPALLLALVLSVPAAGWGHAADLRSQCLAWASARGREQVKLANRIGREQLLTKTKRLAEPSADDTADDSADDSADDPVSLYSWSDLQRLCRRQ